MTQSYHTDGEAEQYLTCSLAMGAEDVLTWRLQGIGIRERVQE